MGPPLAPGLRRPAARAARRGVRPPRDRPPAHPARGRARPLRAARRRRARRAAGHGRRAVGRGVARDVRPRRGAVGTCHGCRGSGRRVSSRPPRRTAAGLGRRPRARRAGAGAVALQAGRRLLEPGHRRLGQRRGADAKARGVPQRRRARRGDGHAPTPRPARPRRQPRLEPDPGGGRAQHLRPVCVCPADVRLHELQPGRLPPAPAHLRRHPGIPPWGFRVAARRRRHRRFGRVAASGTGDQPRVLARLRAGAGGRLLRRRRAARAMPSRGRAIARTPTRSTSSAARGRHSRGRTCGPDESDYIELQNALSELVTQALVGELTDEALRARLDEGVEEWLGDE